MKKRVLFTSAVVALTMGLSLDAQAQNRNWHIRGINAQLPFDSGVFVGGSTVRQVARQLTPNKNQLRGLSDVVDAAQPSARQARATGRATTKALRNLGSVEGPTVTFDSGSYNAKPSLAAPLGAAGLNAVAAGLNAGGNAGAAFFGGTLPALLGAPQPQ